MKTFVETEVSARLAARLTRVTSSGDLIAEADGLRFLAVAAVVVFHVRNYLTVNPVADYLSAPEHDWAGRLTLHGHYGVHLFFVISGFILALPFARWRLHGGPAVGLAAFFKRRLTRLEPPYVLVMLGAFAALVLYGGRSAAELWPRLAAGLAYAHTALYGELNPVNIVAWSLEVEVQFYLLTPLFALVFAVRRRRLRRTLIVAAAAACAALQVWLVGANVWRFTLVTFLQYFLTGFLLADLYLDEARAGAPRRRAWDWAALAALPLMWLVTENTNLARFAFPVLVFVLFRAALRGPVTNRLLTLRWVTVVGGMCYTIYLTHLLLLALFERALGPVALTRHFWVNLCLHTLLFAPALLACAAVFFVLVERPCMRRDWPRRLWGRVSALARRAPAVAAAERRDFAG
jgi:peptidoglycan/LPS O-acetylase OafA/YrhL